MIHMKSNFRARKDNRYFLWVTLLFVVHWSVCRAFTSQSPLRSTNHYRLLATQESTSIESDGSFENVAAAVIVPGFLTGADEFEPLCKALTSKGIPTIAVPMPNWHWLPCLGGRSARPILERIDFAVQHLIAHCEDLPSGSVMEPPILPKYDYSLWDCWIDFRQNPGGVAQVGGSSKVDEYPIVEPRGKFPAPKSIQSEKGRKPKKKIALIGHSAGGWISRVYLSSSDYGGKAYCGSKYIHSLVTLGTPHTNAPGPAFEGIEWINRSENEACRFSEVRSLAVAGNGFSGGEWGGLTQGAYSFCCPNGTDGTGYDGDGVTPIFSALGMPESESLILEKTHHFCWSDVFGGEWVSPELTDDHKQGGPWYGSDARLDQWAKFIHEATATATSKSVDAE